MEKPEIVALLRVAHDKYFRLLMESYPSVKNDELFADFGPPELCELALEAHSCVIALGSAALRRLSYIGFEVLYPFDNPVDLYNWRLHVKNNRVDHTIYASIAIRIDSEIKRMSRVFELGGGMTYEVISQETFLVSKDRYKSVIPTPPGDPGVKLPPSDVPSASVHIKTLNITNPVDSSAVSSLENLEKRTTVWSNFSNIVNVLRSLFGG